MFAGLSRRSWRRRSNGSQSPPQPTQGPLGVSLHWIKIVCTRGWHVSIAHTTLWFYLFLMVFTSKLLWCLRRLNAGPLYALYHTWLLISELQIDPYAVSCCNPQVLSGYKIYTHLGFNRPTLLPQSKYSANHSPRKTPTSKWSRPDIGSASVGSESYTNRRMIDKT